MRSSCSCWLTKSILSLFNISSLRMTTQDLLRKLRSIELKTKGLSTQIFSGTYKTTFKGRGMSFSEVRPYQYGDDVRNIDWNVTARSGEPHVKVFEEERELVFMLLIDISASSVFGSGEQSKREYMAELAATLAFSAINNNDKVGALFFAEGIEEYLPPQKGRNHIMRILRALLQLKAQKPRTNMALALRSLSNLIRQRCTSFIISDFIASDYEEALKLAANRHDVVGIRVYDPMEAELPNAGLIPILDAETGHEQWLDSSSPQVREAYRSWYDSQWRIQQELFWRSRAEITSISTSESYVKALIQFFKSRA